MIRRMFNRKPKPAVTETPGWIGASRPELAGSRADAGVIGCSTCFNGESQALLSFGEGHNALKLGERKC